MAAPTRMLASAPQRAIWSSHPRSCWMRAPPGIPDEVGLTLTWATSPLGRWTVAICASLSVRDPRDNQGVGFLGVVLVVEDRGEPGAGVKVERPQRSEDERP